jgi:hypothetical protein
MLSGQKQRLVSHHIVGLAVRPLGSSSKYAVPEHLMREIMEILPHEAKGIRLVVSKDPKNGVLFKSA